MKRIDQDGLSCAWCGTEFKVMGKQGPLGPEHLYVYEFGTRLYCPEAKDCLVADTKLARIECGVSGSGRTVLFGQSVPTREEALLYLAGSLIEAVRSYRARTGDTLEGARAALRTCRIVDAQRKVT